MSRNVLSAWRLIRCVRCREVTLQARWHHEAVTSVICETQSRKRVQA